mmetsp:Transcript_8360/g.20856  ORF Transcript_8360/g.20856 Transcript_8360/m.20856 type:complete len:93 (+) Transcript_8360:238-516(+)
MFKFEIYRRFYKVTVVSALDVALRELFVSLLGEASGANGALRVLLSSLWMRVLSSLRVRLLSSLRVRLLSSLRVRGSEGTVNREPFLDDDEL